MSKRVRSIWIGLFFLALGVVQAGYLSVNMTTATQCGTSIVRWSGDAGPYHLLLTPTEFKEHGYNVWIESIPDGQNSYELLIRQPAGLQYMLTVWGASGIQYAATTDVLTVQPSLNNTSTCFLSDDAILNLYTFSFNLTSNSGSYPPQCSNMSMTWPTSLESNVTSDWVSDNSTSSASASAQSLSPRSTPLLPARGIDAMEMEIFEERDPSSSEHGGNTTHPPTMFGIIPLGNSFSIPITYNRNSKYAKYLPDSSLSDNPTTYTSQGVTHLNWTVDMAKGTRFILVAGIGSQEKWASGGSSSMFTVGQGSSGCIGSEQNGGGAPSVTATTSDPTGTSGQDNNSPPPPSTSSPVTRTVVASVLSVIGTLVIVGIIFMCRRARNRRKLRATAFPAGKPSDSSDQLATLNNSNSETPLDLIASRNDGNNPPRLSPLVMGDDRTNGSTTLNSTPISPINPFDGRHSKMPFLPPQSTDTYSSPISPIREGTGASSGMIRHPSQDALLPLAGFATNRSGYDSPIGGSGHGTYQSNRDLTSSGTGTYMSTNSRAGRAGPLHLHEHDEQEDTTELKRDTIACLDSGEPEGEGEGGTSTNPRAPSAISAPPGRRRRPRQQTQDQEREVEFRIHRDAGRVQPEQTQEQEVMELPPRYDEVNWEEERERERQTR